MTVTAQGLSAQGLPGLGMGSQPGLFSPAFPAPAGAEQFFGIPQAYGSQAPIWPQPAYAAQPPYGMPVPYGQLPWIPGQAGSSGPAPFGFTQPNAGLVQPQQVQQLIGQLVGQILPVAQQMILPQVIASAVQVVQQQVQQLIAQLAVPQLTGQPFWAQPAATPSVPGLRPYAGLS